MSATMFIQELRIYWRMCPVPLSFQSRRSKSVCLVYLHLGHLVARSGWAMTGENDKVGGVSSGNMNVLVWAKPR